MTIFSELDRSRIARFLILFAFVALVAASATLSPIGIASAAGTVQKAKSTEPDPFYRCRFLSEGCTDNCSESVDWQDCEYTANVEDVCGFSDFFHTCGVDQNGNGCGGYYLCSEG